MKFDIRHHNPDPAHIKSIIAGKGLSNAQAARLIGVSTRTVDAWTSANDVNHRKCSYAHQWALESIPAFSKPSKDSQESKTAAQEP